MLEEIPETFRLTRIDRNRRKMNLHTRWLMKPVVARSAEFCCPLSDHVGHGFESTAVVRHESDSLRPIELVTRQGDNLFDVGVMQNVTEHVCQLSRRESSRRRATTVYVMAATTMMLNTTASSVRFPSIHCCNRSCQVSTFPVTLSE